MTTAADGRPRQPLKTSMPEVFVRRQSLAAQVADAVLRIIHDEELLPGAALPSTADLADRFNVSRTVVREALADLAGRGFVERTQGRESVVAAPGHAQLEELLRYQIRINQIEGRSLIELRQVIEYLSARLAAEHRNDDQVAALEDCVDRMAASTHDLALFYEADIEFHRTIAVASGNLLIPLVLDAFAELMRDLRPHYNTGQRQRGRTLKVVTEEHRRILAGIRDGDPDAAAAGMLAHLDASKRDLEAAAARA
jgi:GntR family transcriptional repressor for pyruvate dehydrogenase complex